MREPNHRLVASASACPPENIARAQGVVTNFTSELSPVERYAEAEVRLVDVNGVPGILTSMNLVLTCL